MRRKKIRASSAAPPHLRTTQGRVLLLLCKGRQTVVDLASDLGLTNNAVRAQLERLIEGGLVRQSGSRPGARRPHAEYELTDAASHLFPKAYEPAIRALLDVLLERLPARQSRELLLETGMRVLRSVLGDIAEKAPRARLTAVVAKIGHDGAGVELLDGPEQIVIRSCSCPLSAVTSEHPELCSIVAELLSGLSGATVRESCTKGEAPRCSFVVAPSPA